MCVHRTNNPVSIRQIAERMEQLGLSPKPAEHPGRGISLNLSFGAFAARITRGAEPTASLRRETAGQCRLVGLSASPSLNEVEVWRLAPVRPSLAGNVQDCQQLWVIAAMIAPVMCVDALFWPPARMWSSLDGLRDAVVTAEDIGLPPVIHLVAFVRALGVVPGRRRMLTEGLAWFNNQEIELSYPDTLQPADALRRTLQVTCLSLFYGGLKPYQYLAESSGSAPMMVGPGYKRGDVRVMNVE